MPPSTQTIRTHVATSGSLPLPLPTTGLLTPLLAGATVARDRAALLSVSTHDRSIWPPSPGYTAATASLSHCPWSTQAQPEAGVCWHAAGKSCGSFETTPDVVPSCPRPYSVSSPPNQNNRSQLSSSHSNGLRVSPKSLLCRHSIAEWGINLGGFKSLEHEVQSTDPQHRFA